MKRMNNFEFLQILSSRDSRVKEINGINEQNHCIKEKVNRRELYRKLRLPAWVLSSMVIKMYPDYRPAKRKELISVSLSSPDCGFAERKMLSLPVLMVSEDLLKQLSDDTLKKTLYRAYRDFAKKWPMPVRNRSLVITHFSSTMMKDSPFLSDAQC